ncbi:hypothetical protein AA637_11855 [Cyanobacterium sp. HL-69]|uniref:hypothetical protein n=1 Tax=Cyanobacterium sp. HL-69 TaxID=2054282 RepID=UPI000CA3E329|nr:hypothetical protein AA637_11855 [Cyanobacterium sp. HL-69]
MANTKSYLLNNYTTDFGQSYNLTFKAQDTMLDRVSANFPENNGDQPCSLARLFKPRKLIVTFDDGKSLEVPVLSIGLVPAIASTLLGDTGVVCVALRGERWVSIPPAILGGSYATTGLAGEATPSKESIFYEYDIDGSSTLLLRTSIETGALNNLQQACLRIQPQALSCSGSQGIQPRRFKGERFNLTTEGKIAKQVIVSSNSEADIRQCGQDIMANFNCMGYQGTNIPNVANFFNAP